jgi:hypothetical protein
MRRAEAGCSLLGFVLALGALAVLLGPSLEAARLRGELDTRLATLRSLGLDHDAGCARNPSRSLPTLPGLKASGQLASWRTVGGCGAGSSAGIGGIKWIGRNVAGGLVSVQCQGSYTHYDDGHVYSLNNQLTVPLGDAWSVGVVVPYLYKWLDDPAQLRIDFSNQGLGDVNGLVTWKLGPIRATAITLTVGVPTGTYKAEYNGFVFPQDRQLGAGKVSGSLMIDQTFDNLWGPAVLGIVGTYPGGENEIRNYRSPSASAYGYAGYLLGPFVPALGLSGTLYRQADRDVGMPSDSRSNAMAAVNGSLEWSTDWLAILAGVSLPFSARGLEPWTAGVGFAVAPF